MFDIPDEAEIVIVGAGPVGLSLAIRLHQSGVRPLLLEARSQTVNTSRAAVIHARTLEMLEPLEVTEPLLREGLKVATFRVRDRDKVLMDIDFSGLDTDYPYTLMCPQDRTEAILRQRLAEVGGAILSGAKVTSMQTADRGIRLSVERDGVSKIVSAEWVVGCDGGHSVTRASAGIPFKGDDYAQLFALADVRMDWPLSRDEVSLFFSPDGLVVVAPLPGDHFRIVATADRVPESLDVAFIQKLVTDRGPTGGSTRITDVVWSSRFHVAHKLADRFVDGRIILCGDAAHVHSPAGGQGMNTGIQDAVSLAPVLARLLRDGDGTALLDWSKTRREIAEDVVSVTDRMTRAATLHSTAGRMTRNAILTIAGHIPGVPEKVARKLAELDRRAA